MTGCTAASAEKVAGGAHATTASRMFDIDIDQLERGAVAQGKTQEKGTVKDDADLCRGVLMPFFVEGNDVLFLAGKGYVSSLSTSIFNVHEMSSNGCMPSCITARRQQPKAVKE